MLQVAGERARRLLVHLGTTRWHLRRACPDSDVQALEAAIRASESRHAGELRIALEAALPVSALLAGITPRARALEVFRELDVWDTRQDNGVLVYVLYAERAIELVADRGYNGKISTEQWDALCTVATEGCRAGRLGAALVELVNGLGELIAAHFPPTDLPDPNELPDPPLFL